MVAAISAGGNSLPPFYVFPRVRWNPSFLNGSPFSARGAAHSSGWINCDIFSEQYLPFVIENTRCSKDAPVLLIMDNHCSHISLQVVLAARENGIVIATLPPHTSHKLQPLDRTVFGPMKGFFNKAMDI